MAAEPLSATSIVGELEFDPITAKRVAWGDWEFTVTAPFTVEVTNASYGFLKAEHSYQVTLDPDRIPESCSCPGYEHHYGPRGKADKHMVALACVGGPVVTEAARDFQPSETDKLAPDGGSVAQPGRRPSSSDPEENDDECDDCAELPDDFPCASCYISGRRDIPANTEVAR